MTARARRISRTTVPVLAPPRRLKADNDNRRAGARAPRHGDALLRFAWHLLLMGGLSAVVYSAIAALAVRWFGA